MKKPRSLSYKLLRKTFNPNQLNFKTTAELKSLPKFVAQERALEAINFGIGIKSHGYNLYAMGPSGTGKHSIIRTILTDYAVNQKTPSDWCYIHNFDSPEKPLSLELPAGLGIVLQQDMKKFIEEISTSIVSVFEGDEYNNAMQEIQNDFNKKKKLISKKRGSVRNNKISNLLHKEKHEKEKNLKLQLTSVVAEPLVLKLKNKYTNYPSVINYLIAVQKDIVTHVPDFIKADENTNILSFATENPALTKYQVNLLVDNNTTTGAPIVFEENPSYSNLICRVEHTQQQGTVITNFTLIKPGALHKANGGYLIIEVRKLKNAPHAWDGLKRALYTHKIKIEPVEHLSDTDRSISITPECIPLDVKVILLGDRSTFYSLCHRDPDFRELFKVIVDFDETIDQNKNNIKIYAQLIGAIIQREKVRSFNAKAVAAIMEYSSRLVEDQSKLSTHMRSIDDLILESDYWAGIRNKKVVDVVDVKRAIAAQIHRIDKARQEYYEDIYRNFILIDTLGETIGQVNCLSVVRAGSFSYGHPTRLTAKVRMGKGKIIDIQQKVKMAGAILSKGSLIVSHFLASHYNTNKPFSLSASLSFEQIYGSMDGDSASVAELCVLLSALADVPLKQYLAITGSVNLHGDIQAVGGVNAKIEGFFDICNARGLNGKQGVIIPAVNSKNLMLRDDVVDAARKKQFFIYPIKSIDEAIYLLTDISAGVRNKRGEFTAGSIHYRVEKKLQEFVINRKFFKSI